MEEFVYFQVFIGSSGSLQEIIDEAPRSSVTE